MRLMDQLLEEIEKLTQERDKLRECLKWYADIRNHNYTNDDDPFDAPAIFADDGQRARTILSQLEGESK